MAENNESGGLPGGGTLGNAPGDDGQGNVQNNMQNGAGGNIPNAGGADWGFLPQGLQSLSEGYDKPETFWADVNRLKGLDREHKALHGKSPESFASEEEWQAFWKAAGKPDAPEGYRLSENWRAEGAPPELMEHVNAVLKEDKEAFIKVCHDCDLTPRQAEKLLGVYGGLIASTLEGRAAEAVPPEQTMRELWPQDTGKHYDIARRGAAHAGVGNALDEANMSAHPAVLKLAHALGEVLGEGGLPGSGAPAAVLPQGEEARQEMYRLIQSDAYRNNDPAAMKKLEALAARVNMR